MNTKKISSFTGLRFIMIMFIVLTHFNGIIQYLGEFGKIHYKYTFDFYMLAVDFFFLLSGFGMMFSYINKVSLDEIKLPSLKYGIKYAVNHVKKIYPVYIATIIFGVLMVFIKSAFFEHMFSKGLIIKGCIKILSNVVLLQAASGMTYFTHAYNGAAWFLSSLFCIYIVSPYIMYFLRKKSKNCIVDIVFIAANIIIILFLNHFLSLLENKISGISGIPNFDGLVYSSPYRRVFYVIIGMNISMIISRIDRENFISTKTATLFEILITVIALIYYSLIRPNVAQYFYSSIIEMIIVISFLFIFSFDKGFISRLLGKTIMQTLGNMAMYIFLIHFVIMQHTFLHIQNKWGWSFITVYSYIAIVLIITFTISWLLYKHDSAKKHINNGDNKLEQPNTK